MVFHKEQPTVNEHLHVVMNWKLSSLVPTATVSIRRAITKEQNRTFVLHVDQNLEAVGLEADGTVTS